MWVLFVGRIIQAASESVGWIVAFTTLTDNVGSDHIGKVLGTAMSFVTAGITTGPMISGTLLQLLGYWASWSAPGILLALVFVARLVMIEKQTALSEHVAIDEQEPLLHPNTLRSMSDPEQQCPDASSLSFYRIVLCNIRVIAGLLNTLMFSIILSGFDATLPLHLQRIFHWSTLPIGMIFLGLQVPGMVLGPIVGWLRDRIGLRYPTTVGWALIAPMLWLLGMSGTGLGGNGKVIFIAGIVGIGSAAPLVRGAGTLQLIGEDKSLPPTF